MITQKETEFIEKIVKKVIEENPSIIINCITRAIADDSSVGIRRVIRSLMPREIYRRF